MGIFSGVTLFFFYNYLRYCRKRRAAATIVP